MESGEEGQILPWSRYLESRRLFTTFVGNRDYMDEMLLQAKSLLEVKWLPCPGNFVSFALQPFRSVSKSHGSSKFMRAL